MGAWLSCSKGERKRTSIGVWVWCLEEEEENAYRRDHWARRRVLMLTYYHVGGVGPFSMYGSIAH